MTKPIAMFAPQTLLRTLKAAFNDVAEATAIAARLDAEADLSERYSRLPGIALYTANVLNTYLRGELQPHVLHAALLLGVDAPHAMATPKSEETADLWQRLNNSVTGVCLPTYAPDLRQLVLAREIGEMHLVSDTLDNAQTYVSPDHFSALLHRSRNNVALLEHESVKPGKLERAYLNHAALFVARIEDEYPYLRQSAPIAKPLTRPAC